MEDKAFFVEDRIDFIQELQFFLAFQNSNERVTFLAISQRNNEHAKINDDYFKNQAAYIYSQTKGITRDLCLHFFAMYNIEKVPSKSNEIYASVYNLLEDKYVQKMFTEKFNSIVNINHGKVIYVDFWAPWCGPCMDEMKHLKELRESFAGKDVVFMYLACK